MLDIAPPTLSPCLCRFLTTIQKMRRGKSGRSLEEIEVVILDQYILIQLKIIQAFPSTLRHCSQRIIGNRYRDF